MSIKVKADDSIVDKVKITVPVSCTMSGTGMDSHTATVRNNEYTQNIGTTTLHAFCNDANGFAIYAAGYTGDEIGGENSTKLIGTPATIGNINTGTATSGSTSNWAMKLAITQDSGDTTGTNAVTIDNSFNTYHAVPNEYTKVAHKNTATDMTASTGGVKLTTTYAAFMSQNQPAGTYQGKVIYTLVHPSDHATPIANPAILDTGKTVNSKLKSLAATVVNETDTTITPTFDPDDDYDWDYAYDEYIKSINVHLETPAPAGFTPSAKNTISSSASAKPIYIVFDNANDAGVMHFYTEGEQIVLSADSSFMFYMFYNLAEISGISSWDASNVTNMSYMFYEASIYVSTFAINLSSWDTSSVTDMSSMFYWAGDSATTWSVGDLSSWNTSNVTNMGDMFYQAGESATTFTLDLSLWDTSSVTDMTRMFYSTAENATTWSIGDLSSWDTSSVTNMNGMFSYAGLSATNWSVGDLSSWDTSSVTNMQNMFFAAGQNATTWSVGDLSSWDTSSVTDMAGMFSSTGTNATTWSVGNLSSWNTSNVTSMYYMFNSAGYSATTFTLNLSSWNTSNVTNMTNMFTNAGRSATTWSVTIPKTNNGTASGPIANTTSRLYGKTTSAYAGPPSGKSFTLAN